MKILISISKPVDYSQEYTGSNGLYSAVSFTKSSARELLTFCQEAGINNVEPDHCTVMYSKTAVPVSDEVTQFSRSVYKASGRQIKWWPGHDEVGYLVLSLDSPELQEEHQRLKDLGARPTFDPYEPHITLRNGILFESDNDLNKYIRYGNLLLRRNPINLTLEHQIVQDLSK